jgi:hypothetical protein
MVQERAQQEILSFLDNPKDIQNIQNKLDSGWGIINLIVHNSNYLAILEKQNFPEDDKDIKVFIPARTKIRLS